MAELPSGTVTFLYTDIEGSTALWEQHPQAMRAAVARHETLLRDAIAAQHGHVFRTAGDGLCAAFITAPEAITTALAAQQALQGAAWGATPLRVRMALHTGAVEVRAGDYVGATLNRLARLLAAAHGGQVLLSSAVHELVRDQVPPTAGLRDLGEHRLRDLVQPEHVYQLLHPDLPADFPTLRTLDTYPHNLPLQLTSFVGREQEMTEVTRLLTTTRLLTLTGTGGCGKTRLALQVAAELGDAYPDGVWLVELAPLADPDLVPQTVATVLGVREQPGQPMLTTLVAALKAKQIVVMLDNCEHLLDASAYLAEALLRGCPGVRVLATSRELLGVAGEIAWRVPSLPVPDTAHLPSFDVVGRYEAVQLFVERATAVQTTFAVTAHNAAALAQVCRRLDGIPLAIELAAARVTALSAEQIAARLDDRFRLLTGGRRTAMRRQQTLAAAIDWSHDLLTEPERVLLRRLAVFAGGWTLEAAEAVGSRQYAVDSEDGGSDVPLPPADRLLPPDVLDLLTRLVEKSLVVVEHGAAARYGLLETVRQYAGDKLLAAGEAAAVRDRHLAWYLALVEAVEPELRRGEQLAWLARLDAEHDNLRVALGWARDADPTAGLRLAGSLWQYWRARGHYGEGRRWLEDFIGRAQAPTAARAKALLGLGILASEQGDPAAARTWLEASLALSRQVGDQWLISWSLRDLAVVLQELGDLGRSRILLEEAGALARAMGDQRGLGDSLLVLGRQAAWAGDYREAKQMLEEGLAVLRAVGDRMQVCFALGVLCSIVLDEGQDEQARHLVQEGLVIARNVGSPWHVGYLRMLEGRIAHWQGALAPARAHLEAVLVEAREAEHRAGVATVAAWLGQVARLQGDGERALALARESAERSTTLESPRLRSLAEHLLGLTTWSQGETATATTWLRQSLRRRHQLGDRLGVAECLEGLATVAAGSDQPARAVRLLGAAAGLREAIGAPLPPVERPSHEATTAAARDALGAAAFAATFAAGQALTPTRAVAEALDDEAVMRAAPTSTPRDPAGLTQREAEVLRLLARGATDAAIAAELSISRKTVGVHVANILGKTGCANRTAAAAFAIRHDLDS
jgi:predicted ATPase/DNA-binding CsgD family transcriptional regulator